MICSGIDAVSVVKSTIYSNLDLFFYSFFLVSLLLLDGLFLSTGASPSSRHSPNFVLNQLFNFYSVLILLYKFSYHAYSL